MKPDSVLELEFDRFAEHGDGIAEHEGLPVYVSQVLPGERARVRIRRVGHHHALGELEEILLPSPHRVTPPCPLFGTCSGCQYQHLAYPQQLVEKHNVLARQLESAGLTVEIAPVLGAPDPLHYRNHARFTVDADGRLGFVARRDHRFFPVDHCMIMDARINETLGQLSGKLQGLTACNLRVGQRTGDLAIQPKLPIDSPASGQSSFAEELCGHRFQVSVAAFFQVHLEQAERLIDAIAEGLRGCQGTLVDAYAGVGTFAVALAPAFERVIAIEESGPAVRDALHNSACQRNVEIRIGRTETVLPTLSGDIAAVILDPPRRGCQPEVLRALAEIGPQRVVYVSCDAGSLARDLRMLLDQAGPHRFVLSRVVPVDMFPQTRHLEILAFLDRIEA